ICRFFAPTTRLSTRTSSPSLSCVPSSARLPLMVTRPPAIQASASRREQMPVSLMYLFSLIERKNLGHEIKDRAPHVVVGRHAPFLHGAESLTLNNHHLSPRRGPRGWRSKTIFMVS